MQFTGRMILMKKFLKIVLSLAVLAAAATCVLWLFRKNADRIPFLSRFTDDEIEPEEDLFAEAEFDLLKDIPEETVDSDPQPEHEERRQTRVRRGYIPLHFHQD